LSFEGDVPASRLSRKLHSGRPLRTEALRANRYRREDYLAAPNAFNHDDENWEGEVTLHDDTYALGGVMAQLFAGVLVEVEPKAEEEGAKANAERIRGLIEGDRIPLQLRDLFKNMMAPVPKKRPSLVDVETQLTRFET
jgi:hypothetical protein